MTVNTNLKSQDNTTEQISSCNTQGRQKNQVKPPTSIIATRARDDIYVSHPPTHLSPALLVLTLHGQELASSAKGPAPIYSRHTFYNPCLSDHPPTHTPEHFRFTPPHEGRGPGWKQANLPLRAVGSRSQAHPVTCKDSSRFFQVIPGITSTKETGVPEPPQARPLQSSTTSSTNPIPRLETYQYSRI
ncbi:hypothetical protein B9Z19DRAFT_1064616 [Tuber borchii]|uniref:Uncharacterized protein n=1 Tax=Tuber borchii TaxID=42251 RepID=A0A2T6ZU23_TUBBO|nr:hypothetical protein B9Z19DRAFT_1064616 [Tuber borchii]